ncbi:MAG: MBL fold metallo-hydrolase [bacterium]|nr:MBL fold metallo-hydrolase [bacterium]
MEELIVLGTGNATVTKCFNTCFALRKEDEYFLVDAGGGNGILVALEKVNIDYKKIHHIFITHEHSDHILGIVWMIRMIGTAMNQGTYEGELTIYCHKELVHTIKTLATMTIQKKICKHFDERIVFVGLEDGDQADVLGTKVTFFDIASTKAKQFGFTLPVKNGEMLTCCGDEPYNEVTKQYVEGSSYLLHEAFCLYEERERFKPYEKHHSTVKDACELATKLGVKHLVLWHTEDKDYENRKTRYLAEGRPYFAGDLVVPNDLEVLSLVKGEMA